MYVFAYISSSEPAGVCGGLSGEPRYAMASTRGSLLATTGQTNREEREAETAEAGNTAEL